MKKLALLTIGFLISLSGFSTHIQGAEIQYEHLGGSQYRVDVLMEYRFVWPISVPAVPSPATTLTIYQRSNVNNVVSAVTIPYRSMDSMSTSNCIAPPFYWDMMVTYSDTLVFDSANFSESGGYILVGNTAGMRFFNNTPDQVANFYTLIPPVNHLGTPVINNSPKSNNLNLRPIVCADEQFILDLSSTDPDGDSLNYRFFTPSKIGSPSSGIMNIYSAPYDYPPTQFPVIQWHPGFSEGSQINGATPNASANQLSIDLLSGQLSVRAANQPGYYLVAVAVEEFRDIDNDGLKDFIGAVYRVLSFEVRDCIWKTNTPPNMSIDYSPSTTYSCNVPPQSGSNIYSVCADSVSEFELSIDDLEPLSRFQLSVEGLNASIKDSMAFTTNSSDIFTTSISLVAPSSTIGQFQEIKVHVLDTSECRPSLVDSLIFYVRAETILGVAENVKSDISLYPNPVSDNIVIECQTHKFGARFSIMNVLGKIEKSGILNNRKTSISIGKLSPGFYTVFIEKGADSQSHTIIVQ